MSPETSHVALSESSRVDFAPARSSIATHGKSFALASLWFGKQLRDEVAALYAYCRRADDAIDLCAEHEVAGALERLRTELDAIYAGEPQTDPVLQAFASVVREREIPQRYALDLLDGMQMDVDNRRYADLHDLLLYCHRVAGVVGLMMCHVMGVRTQVALRHAAHLGVAMQLTNICRDVHEDWLRGRLYLPTRWLAARGAPTLTDCGHSAWPDAATQAVARVASALLDEADRYYRSGDAGIVYLPFRAALAVRTARHVYAAIGTELRKRDFDVRLGRARVSLFKKLCLTAYSVAATFLEIRHRLRLRAAHVRLSAVRFEDVLPL